MSQIIVNHLTNWEYLPWTQINIKTSLLQNNIYKMAKECNLKKLQKIQSYTIHSNDVILLAIQQVSKHICQYYKDYSKTKFALNNGDKWVIYQAILNNYIGDKYIEFIVDKVQQRILYMCIKPEWEAKLEPIYRSNIKHDTVNNYLQRISRLIKNNNTLSSQFKDNSVLFYKTRNICKYMDINNLINRIQAIPYITDSVYQVLNYQNITEFLKDNVYRVNWYQYNWYNLNRFIYRIISSGFQWYTMLNNTFKYPAFNILKNFQITTTYDPSFFIFCKKNLFKNSLKYNLNYFLHALGIKKLNKEYLIIDTNIYNMPIDQSVLMGYVINHKNEFTIQINSQAYMQLIKQIRNILYHKDFLKRSKNNFSFDFYINLEKLKTKILDFYLFYYPFLNSKNSHNFLELIDMITYKFIHQAKKKIGVSTVLNLL